MVDWNEAPLIMSFWEGLPHPLRDTLTQYNGDVSSIHFLISHVLFVYLFSHLRKDDCLWKSPLTASSNPAPFGKGKEKSKNEP